MNRSKNFIKTFVFAFAFLLTLALTLGITGAWYNTRRQADGVITMSDGIIIEYSGFGQGSGEWQNNSADFLLFATNNEAGPGTTATLNAAGIKAGSGSANFFVRAKLEYKFFTDVEGLTEVTSQIADYSAFVNTPTFAQGWVDSNNGDGWFYYATGSTFNTLPSAEYVNIFTPGQSITLNGAADGFNHQGGGYQYSNEILIKRVTVVLTLEAYQADLAAAANAGWEISPLVENSNSQVVEIYSNQITLGNVGGAYKLGTGEAGSLAYDTATLGTTLKIVVAGDSQINANAFENSGLEEIYIGDQEYINGVSSYAAKIYSTPATFIIGANAFAGCTNLQLHLASGVNYTIYTNAVPSTATVYYNGNEISLPSVSGAVDNTTITMETPSIVGGGSGGGSGAVSVSQEPSYGAYTYEDAQGNIWYFDVGICSYWYSGDSTGFSLSFTNNNNASTAQINAVTLGDISNSGQEITVPSIVTSNELVGAIIVNAVDISFTDTWSFVGIISSIVIPNTVEYITSSIPDPVVDYVEISENNKITVTIPNSVIAIGYHNCESVFNRGIFKPIALPSSLLFLSRYSLKNTDLTSDGINNCTSLVYIGESALAGCNLTSAITLPNTLDAIGWRAFSSTNITAISIPASVRKIYDGAFSLCPNLTQFSVDVNNPYYSASSDGRCLIENMSSRVSLISFAPFGILNYTNIPNIVTLIASGAFSSCTSLVSVTIPSSVISIEDSFSGCTGLISITIPSSVESIGFSAFSGCTGLTSITIPSSVTSIGNGAFYRCHGLTEVTIPSTVESIESSAFAYSGLQSVTFEGDGRTEDLTIGRGAFSDCSNLVTVNFDNWPAGVNATVGDDAFADCDPNLVVNIPNQD